MTDPRPDDPKAVEFAMRQGDRCRNYGPEHERTENENCIVMLVDEVERLRRDLWVIAECIFQNVSCGDAIHWAQGIKVSLAGNDSAPRIEVKRG